MSLRERLISRISRLGPMRISDFMIACLHDPEQGYYATRPDLGEAGDFITAPHVSQMFGELLGLWAADVWVRLGRPERVRLVELGPGDGTMMSDILRAARTVPGFRAASDVWLVETSAPLRSTQAMVLDGTPLQWVETIASLPRDLPCIILANEFLDCLPIEQWVRRGDDHFRRHVGVDAHGELAFIDGAPRLAAHPAVEAGIVIEHSPAVAHFGREIGELIARARGAALFIDYGSADASRGDTLQAIRKHRKEGALAHPGEADLTAHVHFPTFLEAARAGGARTAPLETQGDFLRRLGIGLRAQRLCEASPRKTELIERQLQRLAAPEHMGELFKVACLHSQDILAP
jgi:NADH dehydrogenase [ubiquinone] 1 alpha subcomplex assembly factor 7